MAKQIITKILDDLTGDDADESVTFALDGVGYEIDLSAGHALELRKFLARYMDSGKRLGRVDLGRPAQLRTFRATASSSVQNTANRELNQQIREWAANNGWELADRGRIPQTVVDAYETKAPNPEWLAKKNAAQKVAAEVAKPTRTTGRKPRGQAAQPEFVG